MARLAQIFFEHHWIWKKGGCLDGRILITCLKLFFFLTKVCYFDKNPRKIATFSFLTGKKGWGSDLEFGKWKRRVSPPWLQKQLPHRPSELPRQEMGSIFSQHIWTQEHLYIITASDSWWKNYSAVLVSWCITKNNNNSQQQQQPAASSSRKKRKGKERSTVWFIWSASLQIPKNTHKYILPPSIYIHT